MNEKIKLAKPKKLSLKDHPILNEKWLQNEVANDTTILGLGELILKDKERIQPRAGRLDLLLQDPETYKRYPKREPKKIKTLAKKWTTLPDQSPIIESAEINVGGSRSDQSGPISGYQTHVSSGRDVSKSHRQTIRNITKYSPTLLQGRAGSLGA